MADIELVIKIPEEMYKAIGNGANGFSNYLHIATRLGTPLPKGHGDLKDVSKFVYDCDYDGCDKICYCDNCIFHIIKERSIKEAPTIIEADKTESEE